ncbi:MAG: hypothetical protein R2747_18915 [Pyrinomonadaceae bacterium]
MSAIKPGGTREQNAVGEWLDRAALIRTNLITTAEGVPTILPYFDSLSSAIACFGRCEIAARSLDRSVAMNLFAERRKDLKKEVGKYNKAGLEQIGIVRKVLSKMSSDLSETKLNQKTMLKRLDSCTNELRLAIAEWDMKGSDARKLDDVLKEITGVIRKKGIAALPAYLDGKMAELQEVRQRADRGAIDNIAWWKILTIVGMVGWFILQVLWCNAFGCQPASALFWWWIEAIHLVAFVLFC